ncbi:MULTISPECIES: RidA family protein [unclassified Anabaena]|uniref:RidA family protein n=1 Tax=unclassified Anabaena TaxID=2619674 RepID=UPI0039C5D6E1
MNRRITSTVNSVVSKLTRRNALLWLGGTGVTTALVAGVQQEASAKQPKEVQLINPPTLYNAPQNGYSHIAIAPQKGTTVYISGQFGSDLQGNLVSPNYEEQVIQSFKNLRFALEAVGALPSDVAKTTVMIVDQTEEKLIPFGMEVGKLWGNKPPANTLIPVPRLALDGMLFEIDAYVVIPDNRKRSPWS